MPPLPPLAMTMPLALFSLRLRPRTKTRMLGTSVAFEGACIGASVDSAGPLGNRDNVESAAGKGGSGGSLAPWGTRTMAPPSIPLSWGDAIVVAIVVIVVVVVVFVSHDLVVEGGVGVAIPPHREG